MSKKLTRKESKVIRLLQGLSLQHQDILLRRFIGIRDKKTGKLIKQTLVEIGTEYNMTNERVRQIQKEAFKMINSIL